MTDRDCHHGEQPSTCYRCELEARVAELEAAMRAAISIIKQIDGYDSTDLEALMNADEVLGAALDGRGGEE